MTQQQQNTYKELKDWLKIFSPWGAVALAIFKFGGWYQEIKQHTVNWDGYGAKIELVKQDLKDHVEAENRVHADIWREQSAMKKDFNDKIFELTQNQ